MVTKKAAAWVVAGLLGVGVVGAWAADTNSKDDPAEPGKRFLDTKLGQFIRARLERLGELKNDLAVSDEQRTKLHDIRKSHRKDIAPLIKTVVEKKRALREAVLGDKPDEQAIRAAAGEVGKAIGDVAVALTKPLADAKKVLTADQMDTLQQFRQEREDNLMDWLDRDPTE